MDMMMEVSAASVAWPVTLNINGKEHQLRIAPWTTLLNDTALPHAPVAGGSWTAASANSAVQAACYSVRETLFKYARKVSGSPLADTKFGLVMLTDGRIAMTADPSRFRRGAR